MTTMEETVNDYAVQIIALCNEDGMGLEKLLPAIKQAAIAIQRQLEEGDPES